MKRKNKFVLSTCIYWVMAIVPFLLSIVFYRDLPSQTVVQINSAGEASNYMPRDFAAWGIPCFCLFLVITVNISLKYDPEKYNHLSSPILIQIVKWVIVSIPIIGQSLTVLYAKSNNKFNWGFVIVPIFGILIIIGNYLPKTSSNFFVGYKLGWTLSDEGNWKSTHKFSGILWMIFGLFIFVSAFFNFGWIFYVSIAILIFAPVLYSFLYYKFHLQKGNK